MSLLRRRPPNWRTIAATYEDAFRVMERKSFWMAEYLRARRDGDKLLGFYRRRHLGRAHPQGANAMTDDKLAVTQLEEALRAPTWGFCLMHIHAAIDAHRAEVAQARLAGERDGMERAAGVAADAAQDIEIEAADSGRDCLTPGEQALKHQAEAIAAAILKEAAASHPHGGLTP